MFEFELLLLLGVLDVVSSEEDDVVVSVLAITMGETGGGTNLATRQS